MTINVLIVDDSATLREVVKHHLESQPEIRVVGTAADPIEAREAIKRLNPDVITLDIEMPRMNGLEFLRRLMQLRPMPVVMVSSLTGPSTKMAVQAMELGAVDCFGKPASLSDDTGFEGLSQSVLSAARADVGRFPLARPVAAADPLPDNSYDPGRRVITIGSSTGGVEALFTLLRRFPVNCPPTFITQHIPSHFSESFARRLDSHCAPRISEARDGMEVRSGMVVIAPGGSHHLEIGRGLTCRLREGPKVSGHRPSVDALFDSARPYGKRLAAGLLTGMGRDGADGLLRLKESGAYTIAQDEETSVVFGMPRAAIEQGAAVKVAPLTRIAPMLLNAPVGARSTGIGA